jgi:hypothetical protein
MYDFTPDVIQNIALWSRKGLPQQIIADKLGVGRRTFVEWLEKGDAGHEPYVRVARAYRSAAADWAEEEWEAAAEESKLATSRQWRLERRFPDIFGARQIVESRAEQVLTVRVELALPEGVTPEERHALLMREAGLVRALPERRVIEGECEVVTVER